MTAPQETPVPEPDGVEGAGSAPELEGAAGTPEESSAPDTSEEAPKSGDYLARVRSDGEFAVEEIRNKDRAVTTANQKAKRLESRYEPLEPYYDRLGGGEGVLSLLNRLNRILENPKMKGMVERFESTGVVPTGNGDYTEFEEPEEQDPRDLKIQALEQQLRGLTQKVGQQDFNTWFLRLKEEFSDDWQELEPQLTEQFDRWKRDGSPELLQSLNYDVLHTLAVKKLFGTPEDRAKRGARYYQRQLEERKRKATDAPSGVATTGKEATTGKAPIDVASAFAQFKREAGITGELRPDR